MPHVTPFITRYAMTIDHGKLKDTASTSGDGRIRLVEFGGHVVWESAVGSGGVLCLDFLARCSAQKGITTMVH